MPCSKLLLALACSLALAGPILAAGKSTKGAKPLSISQGRTVELADFLVTGRTTVFFFTSEYSPSCRVYSDPLLRLHQRRDDLAVVKVDINRVEYHHIDWESPVARQYEVSRLGLPYFKIFGPDGQLLVEGPEARNRVTEWIEALK